MENSEIHSTPLLDVGLALSLSNSPKRKHGVAFTDEEEAIFTSSVVGKVIFQEWNQEEVEQDLARSVDKFTDPDGFLPLTPSQNPKFHSWKRPASFIKDPKMILLDKVSTNCVQQTLVASCCFLAALTSIALHESKFNSKLLTPWMFPHINQKPIYNSNGKYVFRLYLNGVPRKVVVDDFLPVDHKNQFLCSFSSNSSEIWVSLLEKAYFKIRGGYQDGSIAATDLQILTGWIPEIIFLQRGESRGNNHNNHNHNNSHNNSPQHNTHHPHHPHTLLWDSLYYNFIIGNCLLLMVTWDLSDSVDGNFKHKVSPVTGLVANHGYSCLDMRVTTGGQMLVKLRNPWNSQRWKGKFSEYDFESWTPQMQKELDYDLAVQRAYPNGIFWIPWEEICKYYGAIHVAWDPKIWQHRNLAHGRMNSLLPQPTLKGEIPSGRITIDPEFYLNFPQYLLRFVDYDKNNNNPFEISLVLNRHIHLMSERDCINVDVYSGEDRIYFWNQADRAIYIGALTADNLVHLRLNLKNKNPIRLVIHHLDPGQDLGHSLQILSPINFKLIKAEKDEKPIFYHEFKGTWTPNTAGGLQFPHQNPAYVLKISEPTTLTIFLKYSPKNSAKIRLCNWNGERKSWFDKNEIVADSVERTGISILQYEFHAAPPNLTVLFLWGGESKVGGGEFSGWVGSTNCEISWNFLPLEEEFMIQNEIMGEWNSNFCSGWNAPLTFHPQFSLKIPEDTPLILHLIIPWEEKSRKSPPACQVSLMSRDFNLLGSSEEGKYVAACGGVKLKFPRIFAGNYVVVASLFDPIKTSNGNGNGNSMEISTNFQNGNQQHHNNSLCFSLSVFAETSVEISPLMN